MTEHTPTPEQAAIISAASSPDPLMIRAFAGAAKALRKDQAVLTPIGFTSIGSLQVGDDVIGKNGNTYQVTGVFPQGVQELFELKFNDGSAVIATADHLWMIQRTDERRMKLFSIRTTEELMKKPRTLSGPAADWGNGTRAYWFMPMIGPVIFQKSKRTFPMDPWLLGLLLGDGCFQERSITLSSADEQIISDVRVILSVDYGMVLNKNSELSYDYRMVTVPGTKGMPGKTGSVNPVLQAIRNLGLAELKSQEKSVPLLYRNAANPTDRLAILQGLMDSDGYAAGTYAVFTSASMSLAHDVKFIVESLGGTATEGEFETSGLMAFRLFIKLPPGMNPFRLERKKNNYKTGQRPPYRSLESITQVASGEAVCISVNSPDNLYITNNFIPTHNTSTLLMAAPNVRPPALALAFNKRIATELRGRLPANFQVQTLNGLGHGIWARGLPSSARIELDGRKLSRLVTSVSREQQFALSEVQWGQVRDLVGAAMQAGLVPADAGVAPLTRDTPDWWTGTAEDELIPEDEQEVLIGLAREVLVQSIAQARLGKISFDDQVYCPTVLGGRWPQFPVVFVDEAQDLSPLNHRMLQLASRSDAKIVAVGDPRQAIYAFRGADSSSMDNLRKLAPSWTDLSLATTFRCPKVIVRRQQGHAPGFRAWDGCAEGEFVQFTKFKSLEEDESWSWNQFRTLADGDAAILCRNNAPLLSLAFRLIRQGIGPVMLGRDIGRGLQVLARKICGEDSGLDLLHGEIEEWEIGQTSSAQNQDRSELIASVQDRAQCLLAVLDSAQPRGRADLISALENLFSRESGSVTLATGHRAKGLEWDLVLHLDPWRVPSKWARREGGAALEQEWNLKYVIETRTRNVLVEANLEDFI